MPDLLRGKYCHKRHFKREFELAKERLKPLGGRVEEGVNDYEAFVYVADGIRLIFYPHRTTARNYNIRVRKGGACDPVKLRAAIFALAENSCMFVFPSEPGIHAEAVSTAIDREIKKRLES